MSDEKNVSVAIIGTAGRGVDVVSLLNHQMFRKMCESAANIILNDWKLDPAKVTLVSGGSAWSDHVAVDLFLNDKRFETSKLLLWLPCKIGIGHTFCDEKSWHTCGRLLNELHSRFTVHLGRSSLLDIRNASKRVPMWIAQVEDFCRNVRRRSIDCAIHLTDNRIYPIIFHHKTCVRYEFYKATTRAILMFQIVCHLKTKSTAT